MEQNLKILELRDEIQNSINILDKNKIHIIYFSYYFNWHNFKKGPLLVTTKLLSLITGKPAIDHVAHISRFIDDGIDLIAKIFEATMERGMEQNDLFDKLKAFQGICYIETLDINVDKVKAKKFENKYVAVPYSKKLAALSGLDGKFNDYKPKTDGGFCSWLESLFLIDQGINLNNIQKGNPFEITPSDLYLANLGKKQILFKY